MGRDDVRLLERGFDRLHQLLTLTGNYRAVRMPDDLVQAFEARTAGRAEAAEAVAGLALHKQNFRRGVERTGLVEPTGRLSTGTGGRPAELFRFTGADPQGGRAPGLALPAQR